MTKAARNEKLKLSATFCNNVSVGLILGGVYLPLIFLLYGKSKGNFVLDEDALYAIGGMIASVIVAFLFHFWGRRELSGMED